MNDRPRLRLFGLPLDPLDMEQSLAWLEERLADQSGPAVAHVSLNAANAVRGHDDPSYAADLDAADIVSPDGQAVVWAGRLLGLTIPERVTGIDLMLHLIRRAPQRGWKVYLVGARPDVVETVARRLASRGVTVVGHRDGYFPPEADADIAAEVAASGAELLFVGMPSPRKERFIIGASRPAGIRCSVGVGGTFDVIAGRVRRAPNIVQRAGLEWMYRLAQEPRRLFGRYTVNNARFLFVLGGELIARARGRRRGR